MKKISKNESKNNSIPEKKNVDHLWEIIKIPVSVLSIYVILSTFIQLRISSTSAWIYPISIFGLLLSLACFFYVGYQSIKTLKSSRFALRAGAYTGAIVGLFSAFFGIILAYSFPAYYNNAILSAVEAGYDQTKALGLFRIVSWANIVFSPVLQALIGAFFSWIGALIFKKIEKN